MKFGTLKQILKEGKISKIDGHYAANGALDNPERNVILCSLEPFFYGYPDKEDSWIYFDVVVEKEPDEIMVDNWYGVTERTYAEFMENIERYRKEEDWDITMESQQYFINELRKDEIVEINVIGVFKEGEVIKLRTFKLNELESILKR